MSTDKRKPGNFEERLLSELRQLVAAPPSSVPARPARGPWGWSSPRPRRRVALVGSSAALCIVGAVTGVLFLTGGATPAYAVTANDDGTVTVEINSLSDAAGLESKLRDAGVPAIVQYLQPGQACKEHSWTPASPQHDASSPGHEAVLHGGIEHTTQGHTRFTISKDVPADQTLVIAVSGAPEDSGPTSVGIALAQGEPKHCEVVPATSGADPLGTPPPGGTFHTEEGGKPGPSTSSSQPGFETRSAPAGSASS